MSWPWDQVSICRAVANIRAPMSGPNQGTRIDGSIPANRSHSSPR